MSKQKDYILGINESELDRLRFQHGVWKETTDNFLEKLNIVHGMKVLDAGSGPGFASFELRERVGDSGEVTALEPSEMYDEYFKTECSKNNWTNMKSVRGFAEDVELSQNYYDIIFSRWVIAFVPKPDLFLASLVKSLKPGGVIALMDYIYEGISLYPRGGAFEKMPGAVRDYYRHGGGNPYVGAEFPKMFKALNLKQEIYQPVSLAGNPDSGVFHWADKFFSGHTQLMVDVKVISQKDGDEILIDWNTHKQNPESIFFSPIIVTASARKP